MIFSFWITRFFLFILQQSVSALLELALGQAFVNAMLGTQADIAITVRNKIHYIRLANFPHLKKKIDTICFKLEILFNKWNHIVFK